MTNSKIAFFVSSHKPSVSVDNSILHTAKQKEIVEFLRGGTDEDKFMAERANEYCELLTQYWAWKYQDADIYAFGHYRRLFSFGEKEQTDEFNIIREKDLNGKTLKKYGLDDPERIRNAVCDYDVIAPLPYEYKEGSVYEQYKNAAKLHVEDLDFVLGVIDRDYPEMADAAHRYIHGNKMYTCNMFFMKKELFADYSCWLFDILRKFYDYKDMAAEHYNSEAMRTPGHLGERLFGIYYTWLLDQKKYRTKTLKIVTFENTDPFISLTPAFSRNNVPIFLATNAFYAKFTAAALQSIAEHVSSDHNYDIIVLHNNLPKADMARLRFVTSERKNISLRFVNPEPLFDSYALYESNTLTKETYYRLIIPETFPAYDKVLYLDSDLVVLDDPAKLWGIDIGENFLGGVVDICHAGDINGFDENIAQYYSSLGLESFSYINAGVLIMNTAALRRQFTAKYLLDFAQQGNFRFQDQDLLNLLCENKIFPLGFEWNYFADPEDSYRGYSRTFAPKPLFDAYMREKENFRILHFAGNEKPWLYPESEFAPYFWKYFRKTPYDLCQILTVPPPAPSPNKTGLLRRVVLRLCPKGTRRRALAKKIYRLVKH